MGCWKTGLSPQVLPIPTVPEKLFRKTWAGSCGDIWGLDASEPCLGTPGFTALLLKTQRNTHSSFRQGWLELLLCKSNVCAGHTLFAAEKNWFKKKKETDCNFFLRVLGEGRHTTLPCLSALEKLTRTNLSRNTQTSIIPFKKLPIECSRADGKGPFISFFLSPPEFILSLWGSQVQRHAKCIKTFPIKPLSPPGRARMGLERAGSAGSDGDFQDCVW